MISEPVRFAAVGLNHDHINDMSAALIAAGAELACFLAAEPDLAAAFARRHPQARQARALDEVLEDDTIRLVASAAIPSERGPLGVATMHHGKDFFSDKPAFTDLSVLDEARRVQAETGRIYGISYSERLQNRAMVRAQELIAAGAIGTPLQTIGVGPHRLGAHPRPAWFFERARYGGILTDIGAHQTDHFLAFTGSTSADVVYAQVGNLAHPETPELEDFGDAVLRGDRGTGYFRVDWFTPDGLPSWGDGRVTVLGTHGFLEVRKNIDLDGRLGSSHLFLSDHERTRYIDCSAVELPHGRLFLNDIRNRTESAMSQAHAFLASELALRANLQATVITRSVETAR